VAWPAFRAFGERRAIARSLPETGVFAMKRKLVFLLMTGAVLLQTNGISCLGTPVAGTGLENAGDLLTAIQNALNLTVN
jgi:hypothetical protein